MHSEAYFGNVFYSELPKFFLFWSRFLRFNGILIFISTFFYIYTVNHKKWHIIFDYNFG